MHLSSVDRQHAIDFLDGVRNPHGSKARVQTPDHGTVVSVVVIPSNPYQYDDDEP